MAFADIPTFLGLSPLSFLMSTVIANVVKQSVIFMQIASFLAMTLLTLAKEKDIGSIPARNEYYIIFRKQQELLLKKGIITICKSITGLY